jgi:arylsulfatase A
MGFLKQKDKMNWKLAFVLLAGLVAMETAAHTAQPAEPAQPNLVLIFIDDMGYGDIGPFGSKLNRTPNLDQMAAEGLKLTSFYAAPVCSASRAQLMTGCYAPRVSVPGVFFPAGPKGLNPKEYTVADYLSELGYATMCVGKWHLGDQREFLPTRQGFDGYFGIPYSNDMGRATLEDGRSVHPLMRDEEPTELLENEGQRRITREYTEEAVRFIEKNKKQRFFLYLPHTAMHVPLFPHPDFVGKSKNGTYGDWVEEVDWSVGQILDTLRKLKLAENTLVVFTSDNGPWASKGKAGGVSGPLRGSKGCTLEGGVREPTIAWWPGMVKPGTSSEAIAGTTDILPTFVSLAGGTLRKGVKIDGVDQTPVLLGQADAVPRNEWFYFQGTQLKAVRSGPWKLAVAPQSLGMGIRERPADLTAPGVRLYNLAEEIGETTNLADKNPDVVARLQKRIAGMVADIGSGKPGPGVRPAGVVENPVTLFASRSRPRRGAPTKPNGKPIAWDKVQVGDSWSTGSAPNVAGKSFTIEAEIEATQKTQGVIVAHGGSATGWSLYLKGDHVIFAVRHDSNQIQRVSVAIPPKGLQKVRASLAAAGELSLAINNADAVIEKSAGPLTRHPQENLCIGHDDANPVDAGSPRKRFDGKLVKLLVKVSSQP